MTNQAMENEYLRVTFNSNGTYNVVDKETGKVYENLGYFKDSGEIGNPWQHVAPGMLKRISGGSLNGMTDINPVWRFQALTEAFGPCGFGWKIREAERGVVDLDTIRVANTALIDTLTEVQKIQREGAMKRAEASVELGRLEKELRDKVLSIQNS